MKNIEKKEISLCILEYMLKDARKDRSSGELIAACKAHTAKKGVIITHLENLDDARLIDHPKYSVYRLPQRKIGAVPSWNTGEYLIRLLEAFGLKDFKKYPHIDGLFNELTTEKRRILYPYILKRKMASYDANFEALGLQKQKKKLIDDACEEILDNLSILKESVHIGLWKEASIEALVGEFTLIFKNLEDLDYLMKIDLSRPQKYHVSWVLAYVAGEVRALIEVISERKEIKLKDFGALLPFSVDYSTIS